MSEPIKKFTGNYSFLSNFHPSKTTYDGLTYLNSEAAFQAAKTLNQNIRKKFVGIEAMHAKNLGRTIPLRPDWETVKNQVMRDVCYAKFSQHPDLRKKLLDTGESYLEEGNKHGDMTWGTVNGKGQNRLGFALMHVRDRLRYETTKEDS